jgi:hypothetical protein
MNRNKIIELAKKIKALAEKGKDGERNAAREKLERLCLKYNILPNELATVEDVNDYYFIINDTNERELLINVSCMILDVPGFKWREKNNCIKITITFEKYKDIYNAFEYYKNVYNEYKRYLMQGIILRNAIGYVPKPQTYTQENVQQDLTPPPQKTEDVDEDKKTENSEQNQENQSSDNNKTEDVSENPLDPIKLMKIAVSLEQNPWKKPLDKNLIT